MNWLDLDVTPYYGWARGTKERLLFSIAPLAYSTQFFFAFRTSSPHPLEICLLASLVAVFFGYYAHLAFRFTRVDADQIVSGWRLGPLGEFGKKSVAWHQVDHTRMQQDYEWRGSVRLIVTTRAGQQREFLAPAGVGATALYSIHHFFRSHAKGS